MAPANKHPTQNYHYPYSAFALGIIDEHELEVEVLKLISKDNSEYEAAFIQLPLLVSQYDLSAERAITTIEKLNQSHVELASNNIQLRQFFHRKMNEFKNKRPDRMATGQRTHVRLKTPVREAEQTNRINERAKKRPTRQAPTTRPPNARKKPTGPQVAKKTAPQDTAESKLQNARYKLQVHQEQIQLALERENSSEKKRKHTLLQYAAGAGTLCVALLLWAILPDGTSDDTTTEQNTTNENTVVSTQVEKTTSPVTPTTGSQENRPASALSSELRRATKLDNLDKDNRGLSKTANSAPSQSSSASSPQAKMEARLEHYFAEGADRAEQFFIGPEEEPGRALHFLKLMKAEAPNHPLTAKLLQEIAKACTEWSKILKEQGDLERAEVYKIRAWMYNRDAKEILSATTSANA